MIVVLAASLALAACGTAATPPLPDLRASLAASGTHKSLLVMIRQGAERGVRLADLRLIAEAPPER